MKIYIKHRHALVWLDITKYVDMPMTLNETVDGTFASIQLTLRTPKELGRLDTTKPIPPKYDLKYTVADNAIDENETNTWHFLTGDNNTARIRKEIVGEDELITMNSLYEHKLTGEGYLSYLDNKYLPNYAITQPKTEFYSTFIKTSGAEFFLNQKISQDGENKTFVAGTQRNLADSNNIDSIVFGHDSGGHYIEFDEIHEVSLLVNFTLNYAKTARATSNSKGLIFNRKVNIFPGQYVSGTVGGTFPNSQLEIKQKIEYYNSSGQVMNRIEKTNVLNYNGGELLMNNLVDGQNIVSLANNLPDETIITVQKNINASKVKVYFVLGAVRREENIGLFVGSNQDRLYTKIEGFDNDIFVKTFLESIIIKGSTSAYNYELTEVKITLLEFVEKSNTRL